MSMNAIKSITEERKASNRVDDEEEEEATIESVAAAAVAETKKSARARHLSSSSPSLSETSSNSDHDDTVVVKAKKRTSRLKISESSGSNNSDDDFSDKQSSDNSDSDFSFGNKKKKKKAAPKKPAAKKHKKSSSKYSSDESLSQDSSGDSNTTSYDEDDEDEDDEDDSEEDSEDDDEDDSDYDYFKYRRRQSTRRRAKKNTTKKTPVVSRSTRTIKAKPEAKQRKNGSQQERRATTSKKINYCEETDEDEYSDNEDEYTTKNTKSANKKTVISGDTQVEGGDANVETIERVLRNRIGKVGATGSKTAIYNVEDHGDPNVELPTTETEPQYLIKWQNWSHIHNTWESRPSLISQRVKGIKKLDNYLSRTQANSAANNSQSPEDAEYLACQAELYDSLIDTHAICERIIASQNADFLCKWQGLPYSECTWEDGELIRRRFADQVAQFERRQNAQTYPPVSVKTQRVVRIRPRFVALKEKPSYLGSDLGLELRDYQLDGLNWLANSWCKQNGIILADEMGLGKTIQAISFLSYVFNEHNLYGPFLIVIPLSTMQGWQRELERWSPEINAVIYLGDSNSRSMIQRHEWHSENKKIKCNAILTTYEILLKDKAFFNSVSWAVLIVDEAHRLKNEDSLLYQTLMKFDTNHRLLITGTPLQNSLKELWSLLHFIMPEKFDSWEDFDRKYSSVLSDGLRFQDLHKELQPYLLRRVKKDVEKSLPAKVEQILRVEMTKTQKQFYKLILTKNFKELCKGPKGSYSSFLNIMMELKKCSNHVYLIRRDDSENLEQLIRGSGKLLLLDKLLRRLKETGHRVLIFSQMVRMLDLLAEYLQYRRFPFQRLDGSIKGEVRRQALDHFNNEQSEDFCFLLSTRAGGLGINLSTADTVIIYDSDWNPQNDLQAQARAHRIGQKNQVNIYRLVCKNSIEEDIVERAKQKMVLDHLVIQRMDTTGRTVLEKTNMVGAGSTMPFSKEDINSILKFGAEELFKEKESNEDEREEQQAYDIDEILKRAETREETSHLTPGEELLSQFKVANFSTMEDDPILPNTSSNFSSLGLGEQEKSDRPWTEIIPESERKLLEIEEENEKLKILSVDTSRRHKKVQPKTAKSKSSSDEDEFVRSDDSQDDDSSDGEHQRKKGVKGGRGAHEYTFKGLNAQEIRRFVRSYRKFPCPFNKIDVIAQDAHLEEKSQACLIDFAKKMSTTCKTALAEYEASGKQDDDLNEKSSSKAVNTNKPRGPTISFNGVVLYPQQILDAEQYFAPLAHFINSITSNEFSFKTKLKQTYWQCEWSEKDDTALLRGIYEHGYGNWEWIKADMSLGLTDKILMTDVDDSGQKKTASKSKVTASGAVVKVLLKPQSKHLRTRIDYLIKVLQNQINTEQFGPEWKKKKESSTTQKKSSSRPKKAEMADDEPNGNHDPKSGRKRSEGIAHVENQSNLSSSSKLKRKHKHSKIDGQNEHDSNHHEFDNDSDNDKNSETNHSESNSTVRKKARTNSSVDDHHHHHHNNHHRVVDHDEASSDIEHTAPSAKKPAAKAKTGAKDQTANSNKKEKTIILSERIFNECKSILRPVKNALKNIDPPNSLSERERIDRIKRHILEIGDKINDHLTAYSDPERIKEWRNYLWVFVAKFTSTWSWERIKDLYKKFAVSRDHELFDGNKPVSLLGGNPTTSSNKSMGDHRMGAASNSGGFHGAYGNRSGDRRDNYHNYKKSSHHHSDYSSSRKRDYPPDDRDDRNDSPYNRSYYGSHHNQQNSYSQSPMFNSRSKPGSYEPGSSHNNQSMFNEHAFHGNFYPDVNRKSTSGAAQNYQQHNRQQRNGSPYNQSDAR